MELSLGKVILFLHHKFGLVFVTEVEVTGFRYMLPYMSVHVYVCPLSPSPRQLLLKSKMNDIYRFAFLGETPLITTDIYLNIP